MRGNLTGQEEDVRGNLTGREEDVFPKQALKTCCQGTPLQHADIKRQSPAPHAPELTLKRR